MSLGGGRGGGGVLGGLGPKIYRWRVPTWENFLYLVLEKVLEKTYLFRKNHCTSSLFSITSSGGPYHTESQSLCSMEPGQIFHN